MGRGSEQIGQRGVCIQQEGGTSLVGAGGAQLGVLGMKSLGRHLRQPGRQVARTSSEAGSSRGKMDSAGFPGCKCAYRASTPLGSEGPEGGTKTHLSCLFTGEKDSNQHTLTWSCSFSQSPVVRHSRGGPLIQFHSLG